MDLDLIRNALDTVHQDEGTKQFLKEREDYIVKDDVVYPDPQFLLRIHGVPTVPRGNLVAINAKWKNGKTFLCDLLCSVFLGGTAFPDMDNNHQEGKVLFFDTEQDISDTARIRNVIYSLIPEESRERLEIYCLRGSDISSDDGKLNRYEFIAKAVEHSQPALVIVDGIADLIYNYNDPIESQLMVNNLASLASKHDCAIITVMHQNKSKDNTTMKGHLGTLLYQKACDVFSVTKVSSLFVCSHTVSRHSNAPDFYFVINDGVPALPDEEQTPLVQGIINRIEPIKRKDKCVLDEDDVTAIFNDSEQMPSKEFIEAIKEYYDCGLSTAYQIIKNSLDDGIITKVGKTFVASL